MPNVVGFKINGSTYEYDHEHLANLPTIDATPTEGSTNAVQSGGVYDAIGEASTDLKNETEELREGLSNIISTDIMLDNWIDGKYYSSASSITNILPTDLSDYNGLSSQYTPCSEGDIFYLTGSGSSGGKLWIWTKSNGDVISRAASNVIATNLQLTAPADAAYLLINAYTNSDHILKRDVRPTLKVSIRYNTVSEMQSSTNLQSGMIVHTLGYNNPNDGLGSYYKISDKQEEYAYTGRVHIGNSSLYAIPILTISKDNNKPNGRVTELVRIAQTYQQSGEQWYGMSGLSHETYPTCFDDNFTLGTYNISCSVLSRLMMYGIDFANSRYGGGENIHRQGYMPTFETQFSFSSGKMNSAAEQALYFAYKGMAYYPNSDWSNVRPGDLCFFSFSQAENNAIFMSIDHVAIYLGPGDKTADGKTHQHFIGANGSPSDRNITTFFYTNDDTYLQKVILCAGFEKAPFFDCPEQICTDPYTARETSVQGVYTYELYKKLESFKAYTIVIDSNDIPLDYTLAVGANLSYRMTYDCVNVATVRPDAKHIVLHLFTPDISQLTDLQKSQIRLYRHGGTTPFTINEFKVYDGWI